MLRVSLFGQPVLTYLQPPRLEDDPDSGITWSDEMKDFIKQS